MTYFSAERIRVARERLGGSGVESAMADFLAVKRAAVRLSRPDVPLSTREKEFVAAVEDIYLCPGDTWYNPFGTGDEVKAGFRTNRIPSNGTPDTVSQKHWSPILEQVGERPRRVKFRTYSRSDLASLLVPKGNPPSLADATTWFYRSRRLDELLGPEARLLTENPQQAMSKLSSLFIKEVGLTNTDADVFDKTARDSAPFTAATVASPEEYLPARPAEEPEAEAAPSSGGEQTSLTVGNSGGTLTPASVSTLVQQFHTAASAAGLIFDQKLVTRFVAANVTKPFVILTGLSGSGKTRLAQSFARWIAPSRAHVEVIAVGADWTGRENILGYPDALDPKRYVRTKALDLMLRALAHKDEPHFLILDEMNLSHVEKYFADILSAIESGEDITLHSDRGAGGFVDRDGVPARIERLPDNLFIVGTVNVDETTYMFSPKVLDRANVIEFRVSSTSISTHLDGVKRPDITRLEGKGSSHAGSFLALARGTPTLAATEQAKLKQLLMLFFDTLASGGAEFGYRTAAEVQRFVAQHKALSGTSWRIEDAIDAQVIQKLLPRLHGSRKKLEPTLAALGVLTYTLATWDDVGGKPVLNNSDKLRQQAKSAASLQQDELHPLSVDNEGKPRFAADGAAMRDSFEKIQRMLKMLEQQGFASFAEA